MSDNDEEFRDSFETVRSRGKTSAESKSGWAVLSAFSSTAHSTRPAITPASVTAKKDFSPLTKLLIVLVPIVLLFGYYSYSQVSGATFFGLTLSENINLERALIAHYTFDGPDVSSTTAFEKGGNISLNAFISSGVKPGIGKIGQGLSITDTNQTITVLKTSAINNLNVVTYSFWAKVTSTSMLSKFRWSYSPNLGYFSQAFSGGGEIWAADFSSAGLPSPLDTDTWYHHVLTYDKTSSANNPTLYINGQVVPLTRVYDYTGTAIDDSSYDLNLVNTNTQGTVDDFRIYNRILSPKEVTQLYQLGAGSTIKICKEASVKDADGNDYNTLAIGSQCWLDRNMNVGTRIDNNLGQTNNGTIDKYCYSNNSANCTTNHPNKPDGGLYQWNEAMQYSTSEGTRGICPAGFHIPTDNEWYTLEKFLTDGGNKCEAERISYGCDPAGTKIATGGKSLFEGNFAGYLELGSFTLRGSEAKWWTSSNYSITFALSRYLLSQTQLYRNADGKNNAHSVRCIQDT